MALSADGLQTVIILYVFTWLSEALMAARLLMRRYRGQQWDLSDYITMVCMVCLLARLSLIHVVLVWGSNNLTAAYRLNHVFTPGEIYRRTVGSKLTLVNRVFYNTYVWLQKCVVMILYKRMLAGLPWAPMVFKIYWAILAATYVVIQVFTFSECSPINHYWQVVPAAGSCSQALDQLVVLGALNIFTDLMLIALPWKSLFSIQRSFAERLRLMGLFSIGIFLVAITVIRLPLNIANSSAQVNRTTWASVESFGAAFVANVPALFTLRRRVPNRSTGTFTGATHGSHSRTTDFQSRGEGWKSVGSRSQVNGAEDDGDKDVLSFEQLMRGGGSSGIMVRRSVELSELDIHGKSLEPDKQMYHAM